MGIQEGWTAIVKDDCRYIQLYIQYNVIAT